MESKVEWTLLAPFRSSTGRRLLVFLAHALLLVVLTLAALWTFLSQPGWALFQNWSWPISSQHIVPVVGVYNPYLWSNLVPDPEGFTRAITDWPIFIGSSLGVSTQLQERLFFVFSFVVAYGISFAAATRLVQVLGVIGFPVKREVTRILCIFLFFVNPAALQWLAGGASTFVWGAPLLCLILLDVILASKRWAAKYAAEAGFALGVASLLDPRLFVWGLLSMLVILLIQLLGGTPWRRGGAFLVRASIVASPLVLIAWYAYSWGNAVQVSIHYASYSTIASYSSDSGLFYTLELMGYSITSIFYASPSVLQAAGTTALTPIGSPAFMLGGGDPLSLTWMLSLVTVPFLAFSSLLFRKPRSLVIPLVLVALLSISSAAGTNSPFQVVPELEVLIGQAHAGQIDSVWQTVIAVPWYIQVLTEAVYVPLMIIGITGYERFFRRLFAHPIGIAAAVGGKSYMLVRVRSVRGARSASRRSVAVVFLLVGLLTLGSWQAFSGSYYPAGFSPGVSLAGVPDTGALTPSIVPAADQEIYNTLASSGVARGVYWPGPESYAYPWNEKWSPSIATNSPLPVVNPTGFQYLLDNNLTSDTSSLLASQGIGYVVIDNLTSNASDQVFGTPTVAPVVAFLDRSPGISLVHSYPPDAWLFSVEGGAIATLGDRILNPLFPSSLLGEATSGLSSLGIEPVYTSGQTHGQLANLTFYQSTSLLNPNDLSLSTSTNLSSGLPLNGVEGFGSDEKAPLEATLPSTGDFQLSSPYENWSATVWSLSQGTSVNVTYPVNGAMGLHGSTGTVTSINYRSSLVNGVRNGVVVDPTGTVTFSATVELSASTSDASAYLDVVASNSSAINIFQNISPVHSLGPLWSELHLNGSLPLGTSYFTIRLFCRLSGTTYLKNLTLDWGEVRPESSTFSGFAYAANNSSLLIPLASGGSSLVVATLVNGSGVLTVQSGTSTEDTPLSSDRFVWFRLNPIYLSADTIRITFSGAPLVSAIAIGPPRLMGPTPVSRLTLGPTANYGYSGTFVSGSPAYVSLNVQYSPMWRLYVDGHPSAPLAEGAFGGTIFEIPSGNHSVSFTLEGLEFFPVLMVTGAVFVILAAASLYCPAVVRPVYRRFARLLQHSRAGK